ncbi:hypothetical protein [Streptomyces sp. NPDC046976]|uniref:hypothetical protein n=1 Tax=Streptomyces sp. NPDC046976 TaxID=3155258 RepID=UPI0033D4DEEC
MRTYVQDGFETIESEDGKARFRLITIPTEDVAPQIVAGHARRRAELVTAIEKRDARAPQWRPAKTSAPKARLPKSADAPGFVADPFAVGDWVEWFEGDTRIVGQVWSHAPAAGSFWITTDRSGVTGRVFHMTRSKVPGSGTGKAARYTYRVGGSTVSSVGAAGADVDMTQLSDSLGTLPETPESYADYVPPKGYKAYAPVSAYVGRVEVRGDRVWYPMVIDGVRMDADAKGNGEWLVSVPGVGREPLAVASAPVVKGMAAERAAAMLRELRERADATQHVGFGAAYSRKYVIREVEAFARECHKCQERGERFTGNRRMFTYEAGRELTMCATHLARALSYRTHDGRFIKVTTAAVEAIGDAQKVMGMRDSLAARAMVAMITGAVDAPEVGEAEAHEERQEASAVRCAEAAEYAADRADRAAEAAESKGATDADGAWSDAESAERAARDADVCARQIPAEREQHAERARAAVTSRQADRRPWGVVEWHTTTGACADDARDAAKRAQQSAKLAAGDRGRADRAAQDAAPEAPVEGPRYRFGRRDAEGRYPVSVDGAPVGHVYRTRRTWWALGLDETRRTDHSSRAEAAARLVGLVDVRAAVAADTARRMRARTVAPRGWRFTTWDAVESGDVVRTPRRCVPVRGGVGDGGPLSPETWGAPVTLTGVERLDNGCVVARGREGDAPGWSGIGALLSTPAYAEIGVLVPDVEAPTVVPAAPEVPVEVVPAAVRSGAAGRVGAPLSRLPRGGRGAGVRAGHTARQGAARQGARQGARQVSGHVGRPLPEGGERGPLPRCPAGGPGVGADPRT